MFGTPRSRAVVPQPKKRSAITCCMECKQRHPYCHDSCRSYKSQREAHDKWREGALEEFGHVPIRYF